MNPVALACRLCKATLYPCYHCALAPLAASAV